MLGFALAVLLQVSTVAVIDAPNQPAVILTRAEAEQQFTKLCADGTDDRRLIALAAALNPMPDWVQFVMNGDASVCNRDPKPVVLVPLKPQ